MAASERWASFIATCATSFESFCLISRSGPHPVLMCCRCGEQMFKSKQMPHPLVFPTPSFVKRASSA